MPIFVIASLNFSYFSRWNLQVMSLPFLISLTNTDRLIHFMVPS